MNKDNTVQLLLEISGKAGAGKSMIIKDTIKLMGDNVIVTAHTGKAAVSIRGMTLCAAFGIPNDFDI